MIGLDLGESRNIRADFCEERILSLDGSVHGEEQVYELVELEIRHARDVASEEVASILFDELVQLRQLLSHSC